VPRSTCATGGTASGAELTVTDLDEQITAAREHGGLWSARHGAQAVPGAGLLVTVGAAGWLGAAVLLFAIAALASALFAGYTTRKNWPLPGWSASFWR
jgi:hypothetical protein